MLPTHIITKRQFVFLKCFIEDIACFKMYKMNKYYLSPQFRININVKVAFICLPFDSLKECIHRYFTNNINFLKLKYVKPKGECI